MTDRESNTSRLKPARLGPRLERALPATQGKRTHRKAVWTAIKAYGEAGHTRRENQLYLKAEAAGFGDPPKGWL